MFGGKPVFLLIISTLVIIQDVKRCWVTADELPIVHGVKYVGVGYNIIDGNPEGGDLNTGGVDPGLLLSRKIFKFTYDEGKKTFDQSSRIPDEVSYLKQQNPYSKSSLSTFFGTKSYAAKLAAQVEVSGGYVGVAAEVQFAASARYQEVADKTSSKGSVFLSNETITNRGRARYLMDLARTGSLLTPDFVSASCLLPATYTEADKTKYMQFMEDWGTHTVIEVNLGIREGENFEEKRSSFVNYAAQNVEGSIQASGVYDGFSASVSVDMESFNSAMDSGTKFGSSYSKYAIGSQDLNEPISVKMIGMPEIFGNEYWTGLDTYISDGHCSASFDRESVKQNMDSALKKYGEWRAVEKSTDPAIQIPLTWPAGVYGLPKPYNGCPTQNWDEGSRFQHYDGDGQDNSWSNNMLFAGWMEEVFSRQEFCMKTVTTIPGSSWQWQPGSYCIYQYGSACPQGFTSGYIDWGYPDDYDQPLINKGVLPSGTDTQINFCCRDDGVASQAIYLPTDASFMLLTRFGNCQLVHDMSVKKEWHFWATDDESTQSGDHPSDGVYNKGVNLIYCYYHKGGLTEFSTNTVVERTALESNPR
eukprot:XP_011670816.1 PREDICTED: uncharacterized protein LOC754760 [Strongylocentrotus purpuratus]